MIDISPKALRFARLAAEQQLDFSESPQVETLKGSENAFGQDRSRRFVAIADDTALFCLRAIDALIARPDRFDGGEWDGNDFVFLQSVSCDLQAQLTRTQEKAL